MLRKIFYAIVFLFALHMHLLDGYTCTDSTFRVCINYEGGETSLVINKAEITKQFTTDEAEEEKDSTNPITIGVFIVTVTTDTFEAFDVIAYTDAAYVGAGDTFQALSNNPTLGPMGLSMIGNKRPDGTIEDTEFFDNSIVITHAEGSAENVMTLTVTAYMRGGQVDTFEDTTSSMPLTFQITGL